MGLEKCDLSQICTLDAKTVHHIEIIVLNIAIHCLFTIHCLQTIVQVFYFVQYQSFFEDTQCPLTEIKGLIIRDKVCLAR